MRILITGGNGFLGKRLVLDLLSHGHEVYLLVRKRSLHSAITFFTGYPVNFIEGDIEDTEVIKPEIREDLQDIDTLVHLAALYDLRASSEESYKANVLGTQNILNLIKMIKSIKYFHYFSTYAVNPNREGPVLENDLAVDDKQFTDFYSKTKNQAEHLVRKEPLPGVKIIIHRPGIIIGDSKSGKIDKTDGPYYFFQFIERLKSYRFFRSLPFLPLPVDEVSQLNVLPVDILVKWSSEIVRNPKEHDLRCYHLVPIKNISTLNFLKKSLELLELPARIIPITSSWFFKLIFPLLGIPKETIFYLQQKASFDQSQFLEDFPELRDKSYQEYLQNIINGYKNRKN